jgi:ubiquitin carboxyl-terminal hydrolase 5/13
MITPELLTILRGEFSKIHVPLTHEKVFNDECVLSFDSPFSENGLYVNLQTFYSYGHDFYLQEYSRSSSSSSSSPCKLFLHLKWKKIPIEKMEQDQDENTPQVLGIGVEGGFHTTPRYEIEKLNTLVVITENNNQPQPIEISLDEENLPEYIRNVCNGILEHQGMKENMQVDTWQADLDIIESKHAANLPQLDNGKKISNDPSTWRCEMSGETNNLWLNLSTGYIGGGRKQWDGTGGSGAALKHYEDTGRFYPLCVKLGELSSVSCHLTNRLIGV